MRLPLSVIRVSTKINSWTWWSLNCYPRLDFSRIFSFIVSLSCPKPAWIFLRHGLGWSMCDYAALWSVWFRWVEVSEERSCHNISYWTRNISSQNIEILVMCYWVLPDGLWFSSLLFAYEWSGLCKMYSE